MIGRLRGILLEKHPPEVVIEVSGIGYEITMPMTCFYELPEINQEVVLFTHFVVREDAQLLYGFHHKQERALFRELIKINSVGPKLALAILSGMSSEQFLIAVENEDIHQLIKLPGVGKKTAERLLIEMKDRCKGLQQKGFFATFDTTHSQKEPSVELYSPKPEQEAISALIALGYKSHEATVLIRKVANSSDKSDELIRNALRIAL